MVEYLKQNEILSTSFNQSQDLIAISRTTGFSIYSVNPPHHVLTREFEGGVRWTQILGSSNILMLIPTGKNPEYDENKILIWDDQKRKIISRIKCQSPIKQISFSNNICIIPHPEFTSCMSLDNQFFHKIATSYNKEGIHAISHGTRFCIAVPHTDIGSVLIQWVYVDNQGQNQMATDLDGSNRLPQHNITFNGTTRRHFLSDRHIIKVNQSGVASLTLNNEGTLLAIASEKGTIIRLYDTTLNKLQYEFRRGTIPSNIHYLQFDIYSQFLICSSNRSKVHVFKVSADNTYHNLYYLKYLVSIAGSQWSFYQCQLEGEDAMGGSKAIITGDKLHIMTKSGKYIVSTLNETGGLLESTCVHDMTNIQSE